MISQDSLQSGAACGALGAQSGAIDPDLLTVVDAWPTLPTGTRAKITATMRVGMRARE